MTFKAILFSLAAVLAVVLATLTLVGDTSIPPSTCGWLAGTWVDGNGSKLIFEVEGKEVYFSGEIFARDIDCLSLRELEYAQDGRSADCWKTAHWRTTTVESGLLIVDGDANTCDLQLATQIMCNPWPLTFDIRPGNGGYCWPVTGAMSSGAYTQITIFRNILTWWCRPFARNSNS